MGMSMIKQKWQVVIDGDTHEVEYRFSAFSGKTVLVVDGDEFTVKGKPFGIGVCRREPIMVCGAQAMLDVDKSGRAKLILRDGEVEEI